MSRPPALRLNSPDLLDSRAHGLLPRPPGPRRGEEVAGAPAADPGADPAARAAEGVPPQGARACPEEDLRVRGDRDGAQGVPPDEGGPPYPPHPREVGDVRRDGGRPEGAHPMADAGAAPRRVAERGRGGAPPPRGGAREGRPAGRILRLPHPGHEADDGPLGAVGPPVRLPETLGGASCASSSTGSRGSCGPSGSRMAR